MTHTQQFQDAAYVLHSRPYRNTSLIVDMFTRAHGRIHVVAKGAKRGQHPLANLLQPFHPLQIQWGGHGELLTLYKAEPITEPSSGTGLDIFTGFYLNELLIRLLHRHDPHPELFDHYVDCLLQLETPALQDIALRYFELDLLESLGYALNLVSEAHSGQPLSNNAAYHYVIEQGPVPAAAHVTDTLIIHGATLIALAQRNLCERSQRSEAKQLMRTVLDHYLGHRPLKSRELLMRKKLFLANEPSSD